MTPFLDDVDPAADDECDDDATEGNKDNRYRYDSRRTSQTL
jgi:hypothetical protein